MKNYSTRHLFKVVNFVLAFLLISPSIFIAQDILIVNEKSKLDLCLELSYAYILDYEASNGLKESETNGKDKIHHSLDSLKQLKSKQIERSFYKNNDWNSAFNVFDENFKKIKDTVLLENLLKYKILKSSKYRDSVFKSFVSKVKNRGAEINKNLKETKFLPLSDNKTEKIKPSKSKSRSWVKMILIISFIALFSLLGFLYKRNKDLTKEEKRLKNKNTRLESEIREFRSKEKSLSSDRKLAEMQKNNKELEDEIFELKKEIGSKIVPKPSEIKKEDNTPKLKKIYLPRPYSGKKINADEAKFIPDPNFSFYEVDVMPNQNKYKIRVFPGSKLFLKAFNSPELFLDGICTKKNVREQMHTKIENVEDGLVQQNGKDWVVIKDIVIKFK